MWHWVLSAAFVVTLISASGRADEAAPLVLEAKIPLGAVSGRIDHMAIDLARQRLFVAELGNDSVGIVDLAAGKLLRRIDGLSEPQGVGYEKTTDTTYVANARDGSVRLFAGEALAPVGRIELGTDADNVRTDGTGQVFVGHGSGAIAVIEAASRRKLADIALPDHPEGFQLRPSQIFVNVPAARAIAVVDRVAQKQIAAWRVPNIGGNFPMALDRKAGRVFAVFRHPPTLVMLDGDDGRVIARASSCGDADDVFVDAKRRQIYVSCGDGAIGVFALGGDNIAARGSVATGSGARTSLFVPERDRLYLAVPSHGSEPAAIWVFRPLP